LQTYEITNATIVLSIYKKVLPEDGATSAETCSRNGYT